MTVQVFARKEFEVVLVAGTSNTIYISVDWLDENGAVSGPLDGYEYETFYCQATPTPTEENPEPVPLLKFSVVHLSGFIVEGDTEPHPGAFLLLCDPTASRVLQTSWVRNGIIDLIGVTRSGQRDYLARGYFTTEMTATRDFT